MKTTFSLNRLVRVCALIWLAVFTALAPGAIPMAYAASSLIDTLSQTISGPLSLSPANWEAQSFTTGATDRVLTSVSIGIFNPGAQTGTYKAEIWTYDVTNSWPGAKFADVGTGNISTLGTSSGTTITFSPLNIVLNPSTNYFVVVYTTSGSGSVNWEYTTCTTFCSGTAPAYDTLFSDSSDAGATWSVGAGGSPFRLQITAGALAPATSISKSVSPAANIGAQVPVTYTVILSNTGTADDPQVLFTDTLPVAVNFSKWVQNSGASVVGNQITWNGLLTATAALTFTFQATNTLGYGGTPVTNTAQFSGTAQANSASATYRTWTIQSLIDAAAPGSTVAVPAGVYTESLTLSKAVSLTGASAATTMINANPNDRVLTVTGASINSSVVISGLTFAGGTAGTGTPTDCGAGGVNCGGGILITGTAQPLLTNLVITHSTAAYDGGGLYADTGSPLTLANVSLINNTAANNGGGAWLDSSAILIGSTFTSNTATSSAGGGAVFSGTAALAATTFTANVASTIGGGAMFSSTASLTATTFASNMAGMSGGGAHFGASAILTGTTFFSNTASLSGGGATFSTSATLTNTVFTRNATDFLFGLGGGATLNGVGTLVNTRFYTNTARLGGGLYASSAVTLTQGALSGNTADEGGGLFTAATVNVTATTFVSNAATAGGGLYLGQGAGSRIVNSLFARNSAANPGAAMYLFDPAGAGGDAVLLYNTVASPTVALGTAIYIPAGTVAITDTIVASYTVALSPATATVTSDYNLFYNAPTAVITGANSLTGTDPVFTNPLTDDYHLKFSSPAIDKGTDAGVYTDFEGDPRPSGFGFDIGYDEFVETGLAVSKTVSAPAIAGLPLAYTITVKNFGPGTAPFTLTDNLPLNTTSVMMDQTDDYSDTLGFGGHTAVTNTQVMVPRSGAWAWVELVNTSLLSGTFTSRAIDASYAAATWTQLRWNPERPYWKELPNNGGSETAYSLGNAIMAGDRVLLHLNGGLTNTSGVAVTITAPISTPVYAAGRFNQALTFAGLVSNTVVVSDAANPVRYALEAWVYPQVVTDTSFILRTDALSGTVYHYSNLLGILGNRFAFYLNDGVSRTLTSTTVVQTGQWYHLVGTAAANGEMHLYVNGVDEARLTGLGTLWSGGDQYQLGAAYGLTGTTRPYTGLLDEVAVYSRTLSGGEVLDHYLRGALRLSFQARACPDAACAAQTFTSTVYSELTNASLGTPNLALTDIPSHRYFEYQARFETDAPTYNLRLYSVQVGPAHAYLATTQGTCTTVTGGVFTCTAPSLAVGGLMTISTQLNLNSALTGVITNTATVIPTGPDNMPADNTATVTTTVGTQADLSLAKYAEMNPVNVGGVITYHLDVYNGGPSTAFSVQVTDTLPSGITGTVISTGAGWSCQQPGMAITCTLASFAPYTWSNIVLTATAPAITGTITNTAYITSAIPLDDPNLANNGDYDVTTITLLADLMVAKTATPSPVRPGYPVTFTVMVTNTGPYTATNVLVTDALQGGALIGTVSVSNTWTCGVPGSTLTCTLASLGPNISASFDLTVTAPLTGFIVNRADVTSDIQDPNLLDNLAYGYAAVLPVADLTITKTVTPAAVYANQPLTYTVTFTNTGPAPAGGVTSTLQLANTRRIGIYGNQATLYPSAIYLANAIGLVQNVTVTLHGLTHTYAADISALLVGPSGQTVMLMSNTGGGSTLVNEDLTFSDAAAQTLPLSGTITTGVYRPTNYGFSGPNGRFPVPAPGAPYGSSLSAFNGASPNGTWQLYVFDTFAASDNGAMNGGWDLNFTTYTTETVTFTDTLPAGLGSPSVTSPAGWTCTTAGTLVSCTALNLAVDAAQVVTLTATAPVTPTILTNTAGITSTTADFGPNPNLATVTNTVLGVSDLGITKTVNSAVLSADQPLTYTLVITNAGPSPVVSGVTVTDTLPAGLTNVAASAGCDTTALPQITCTLPSLAVNTPTAITITAIPTVTGLLTNTAGVTATVLDLFPSTNFAQVTATVISLADVAITKTVTPTVITPNALITYTLTISNNGPSNSPNLTVTDTLPITGFAFGGAAGAGWACNPPSGGVVTCTLSSLAQNTQSLITLTGTVTALTGTLTNTAWVTSTTDFVPGNNGPATVVSTITPMADLSIAKGVAPNPVFNGGLITYTLVFTNNGPSPAAGALITDPIPAEVIISSTLSSGAPITATGSLTPSVWQVGALAVGQSGVITLTGVVSSMQPMVTNTAQIAGTTLDLFPANDTAVAPVNVIANADLALAKSASPNPVLAGGTLTYTFTISNAGPSTVLAGGLVLTDALPAGFTYGGTNTANWTCPAPAGNLLTCTYNALLSAGAQTTFIMTGTAGANVTSLTNTAGITGTVDMDPSNNVTSTTVTVIPAADLAISKSASPVAVVAGTSLTYTILVTNTGPSAAQFITVTDTLPASGFLYTTGTGGCGIPAGTVVVCTQGSLAAGSTATFTLIGTVTASAGTLTNSASVVAATVDPMLSNNGPAQVSTRIIPTTTTTVASALNPSTQGQVVTFTATIAAVAGTPDGTVTFSDGATVLGTAPVNGSGQATLSTSTLAVGLHTITANYSGSANFAPSSGVLAGGQQVNIGRHYLYLPLMNNRFFNAPDLVGSFTLGPDKASYLAGEPVLITATITNTGQLPTTGPFWVDFYINPTTPPSTAVRWDTLCNMTPCFGISWLVKTTLKPGESLTLSSAPGNCGGNCLSPYADNTIWLGYFANGTASLYLYVDSYNSTGDPNGLILENNETNNRSTHSPITVTGANPHSLTVRRPEDLAPR